MAGYRRRALHRAGRCHWRFADPGTAWLAWATAVVCARKFDAASVAPGRKLTRQVRRRILTRIPGLRLCNQGPEAAFGRCYGPGRSPVPVTSSPPATRP
ncbi:MAG: hypothetical protein ABSA93_41005 [Streptosporangiaceae bacterium]|jgi:hypothetical protein